MNNIRAFKALILKYESITQEMIDNCDDDPLHSASQQLTGFGTTGTCTYGSKQPDKKRRSEIT